MHKRIPPAILEGKIHGWSQIKGIDRVIKPGESSSKLLFFFLLVLGSQQGKIWMFPNIFRDAGGVVSIMGCLS
jgi:hypothetical protein